MRVHLPRFVAAVAAALTLAAATARAQEQQQPIKWSLEVDGPARSFKRGATLKLRITARVEAGWHLYAVKQRPGGPQSLSFSLPDSQPLVMNGEVLAPAAKASLDRNFNRRTSYYEGTVTFTLPVKVSAVTQPGTRKIRVRVFYQSCNERLCFPPRDATLEGFISVRRGAA